MQAANEAACRAVFANEHVAPVQAWSLGSSRRRASIVALIPKNLFVTQATPETGIIASNGLERGHGEAPDPAMGTKEIALVHDREVCKAPERVARSVAMSLDLHLPGF
jgi:hypothetical protein